MRRNFSLELGDILIFKRELGCRQPCCWMVAVLLEQNLIFADEVVAFFECQLEGSIILESRALALKGFLVLFETFAERSNKFRKAPNSCGGVSIFLCEAIHNFVAGQECLDELRYGKAGAGHLFYSPLQAADALTWKKERRGH